MQKLRWNPRAQRSGRTPSTLALHLVLSLLALFSLYPLLLLVFNSLKTNRQISLNPLSLPPLQELQWSNYPEAWMTGNYAVTMRNSALIAFGTVLGVLVVAGLAAYSLARLNPRGGDLLILYFLVISAMPMMLSLYPLFYLWKTLGLLDTLPGLIIILIARNSTFATFLLRSYMVSIPGEFEDAARVDGASPLQVFRHIVLPLCAPGFLATGLIIALWSWNEFLLAVTFVHDPALKPVATSLYAFSSRYSREWGLTSAASVIMLIPSAAIFLYFQRRFIEGMTQGGLKG